MDQDQWTWGDSCAYLLIFIRDHLDSFILSIKMSTALHLPAKLYYVPIVQHDVGQSAGVQMSNILPAFQCEINTFSFNILWLASHYPTCRKNNKAVIAVVNEILLKRIFSFIRVEVHPLFSLSLFFIHHFFSMQEQVGISSNFNRCSIYNFEHYC